MIDLDLLYNMGDQMSKDHKGYMAMYTANQMINNITAGNDRFVELYVQLMIITVLCIPEH